MKRCVILLAGLLCCVPVAWAEDLGIFKIGEYLDVPGATHQFSTGNAYQPTTLTYSIYADGSATGIVENVDMVPASPFDGVTGAYWSRVQLTTAAGYVAGKHYRVLVKATVDGVSAVAWHGFEIEGSTGDDHLLTTSVASATSASQFALTAGFAVAGAYTGNVVTVTDATSGLSAARVVVGYGADLSVILDSPLPFVPATGDEVAVSWQFVPMIWGRWQ